MDTETRAAFAAMSTAFAGLSDTVVAGFARTDHYFELQQAQFLKWREELRAEVGDLRDRLNTLTGRVDSLAARMTGVEHEVAQLRDFMTREIGEIRLELRDLRTRSHQTDELRREIADLAARVDRLEQRQPN